MATTQKRTGDEPKEPVVPNVFDNILDADAQLAVKLMQEGITLQEEIAKQGERLEEIKQELLEIQQAHDCPGFRYGDIVFIASYVKGRRQLNRELLVENGCPPEIIQRSYKEGEASWRRQLKRVQGQ